MNKNSKPFVLDLNIVDLLDIPDGNKLSVNIFPKSIIEDCSKYKEYKSKYLDIILRANHIIEMSLYNAAIESRKLNLAVYCFPPTHKIQDNNKLTSSFFLYKSEDIESNYHGEEKPGNPNIVSFNISKYLSKISQ